MSGNWADEATKTYTPPKPVKITVNRPDWESLYHECCKRRDMYRQRVTELEGDRAEAEQTTAYQAVRIAEIEAEKAALWVFVKAYDWHEHYSTGQHQRDMEAAREDLCKYEEGASID